MAKCDCTSRHGPITGNTAVLASNNAGSATIGGPLGDQVQVSAASSSTHLGLVEAITGLAVLLAWLA